MKTITIDDQWARLATELGVDATVAGPPITTENARLDVVGAELLALDGYEKAVIVLRVRTKADRVLEFDMELEIGCVLDATDDYDLVDGELVEHRYDHTKPTEIARFFGETAI